jgi:hypothetical protein
VASTGKVTEVLTALSMTVGRGAMARMVADIARLTLDDRVIAPLDSRRRDGYWLLAGAWCWPSDSRRQVPEHTPRTA